MPAVSETIVREYFELHEFLVRQRGKYIDKTQRDEDDDIDFFVLNPHPQTPPGALPFVLRSPGLPFIRRAIVVVKAWHSKVFSQAQLAASPETLRFADSKFFQQAARSFAEDGAATVLKILVAPALPRLPKAREETIALLRAKGLDAVLPFRALLADLVNAVQVNRDYQKSDLLQTLRILKNYDLLKGPQLELFKTRKASRPLKR